MRFRKLGAEDVGEASSRRHLDPETGREEYNISDADLAMTPPLEEEPEYGDILPDQIKEFARGGEEEGEVTARPTERVHPMTPGDLPEG